MSKTLAFFGAFNPPTRAHLALAELAMNETGGKGVVFVPSKCDYIRGKQGKDYAFDDQTRLRFLSAAAKTRPWMSVSDIELRLPAQPRTYETLCRLRDAGLDAALLTGSDNLKVMDEHWLYVEEIAREFGIVCLARSDDDVESIIEASARLKPLKAHIRCVATPPDTRNVSSTEVRLKLKQLMELRRELSALVPEEITDELIYARINAE